MSLVVARKYGTSLYIVSDTKITRPNCAKNFPTDGVIKSVILGRGICLSWAGVLDFAEAAIRSLDPTDASRRVDHQIVDHFLKHHLDSDKKVDFVIAFGHPAYRLVKISDGNATDSDAIWLGDKTAFETFQAAMAGQLQSPATSPACLEVGLRLTVGLDAEKYSRMKDAMTAVVESSGTTAGGFVTTVGHVMNGRNVGLSDGFNYLDYFDGYTHNISVDASHQLPEVRFSTAAEGGYNYYFLRGYRFDGTSIVAAYFPQGNFGLVYLPRNHGLLHPHLVRDSRERDFAQILQSSFGVTLPAWPGREYKIKHGSEGKTLSVESVRP